MRTLQNGLEQFEKSSRMSEREMTGSLADAWSLNRLLPIEDARNLSVFSRAKSRPSWNMPAYIVVNIHVNILLVNIPSG